jgi:hypothetical protein
MGVQMDEAISNACATSSVTTDNSITMAYIN